MSSTKRRLRKSSPTPGRFRLPATVNIVGKTYRVTVDPESYDCCFRCDPQEICIGTKHKPSDEVVKGCFLHEVAEAILVERLMRYRLGYTSADNSHYLFSFNHKEFEFFAQELAVALRGVSL